LFLFDRTRLYPGSLRSIFNPLRSNTLSKTIASTGFCFSILIISGLISETIFILVFTRVPLSVGDNWILPASYAPSNYVTYSWIPKQSLGKGVPIHCHLILKFPADGNAIDFNLAIFKKGLATDLLNVVLSVLLILFRVYKGHIFSIIQLDCGFSSAFSEYLIELATGISQCLRLFV